MSERRKPKQDKHAGGRPTKHPWDEIRNLFVQGEDRPNEDGTTTHVWPTKAELSSRYNILLTSISRRSAMLDTQDRTWDMAREAFQSNYQRQVDEKLATTLAGKEVTFRLATSAGAELAVRQIARQLGRPQGADTLAKLTQALKKAQETGLVAMDRPANGPGDGDGADDWSALRKLRQGAHPTEKGQGE